MSDAWIHQTTSFAKGLTFYRTSMFIAVLSFTVGIIADLPAIFWRWVVTLSASFTSSSITGGSAFSPLRPWGPSSINCRQCSTNSTMEIAAILIKHFILVNIVQFSFFPAYKVKTMSAYVKYCQPKHLC